VRERQRCTPRCQRLFVERLGNHDPFPSVKKMTRHDREAVDACGSEAQQLPLLRVVQERREIGHWRRVARKDETACV
jgi:hypothetical protein